MCPPCCLHLLSNKPCSSFSFTSCEEAIGGRCKSTLNGFLYVREYRSIINSSERKCTFVPMQGDRPGSGSYLSLFSMTQMECVHPHSIQVPIAAGKLKLKRQQASHEVICVSYGEGETDLWCLSSCNFGFYFCGC